MIIEDELRKIAEEIVGNTGESTEDRRYCTVTGEEFVQVAIRYAKIEELKDIWSKWMKAYLLYATYATDFIIYNGAESILHWRITPEINKENNLMRARLLITTKEGKHGRERKTNN